jgi:hypothetical protein
VIDEVGNSAGASLPPASLPPPSYSGALTVVALIAGIVILCLHHDITGLQALGALTALAVPENPLGIAKRLLGKGNPK